MSVPPKEEMFFDSSSRENYEAPNARINRARAYSIQYHRR